ncbi:hypothetical protein [Clostridium sp.]|uniref:hypothetical protein n=1 Tax=Clostridium sp. TaxID=1506 RepID=UPI001B5D8FD1|nr:hypothetical protein [Clostridium sp.]MBP3916226.1 hypothetical protein [Clostridium sp.]
MIRSSLFSRKEIVELIRKSPKTKDGFYFFPRFKIILLQDGTHRDNGFYYDRSYFKDYICFNEDIISVFLSKTRNRDLDLFDAIQRKVNEVIKGYEFLNIKDHIPNEEYTLEELIDTTIYMINYKYSNH